MLSPQVELSPLYYHYLKYNLLEYRYSSYNRGDPSSGLMGLSLELPTEYLNDSAPLVPPSDKVPAVGDFASRSTDTTPFLWQAPNSNAALYFGDKWMELHSFLSNRIAAQNSASPPSQRSKQVSQKYPSWMEYVLELMRAQSYTLLYPNLPASDSIVTVHNELYQLPEEFSAHAQAGTPPPANGATPSPDPQDSFTVDPAAITHPSTSPERPLLSISLLSILSSDGDLPNLDTLPILSHSGQLLHPPDAYKLSSTFATEFRHEIGGCNEAQTQKPLLKKWSADDLFCLDDQVEKNEEPKRGNGVQTVKKLEPGAKKTADTGTGREVGAPVVSEVDKTEEAAVEFAAHLARQGPKRED